MGIQAIAEALAIAAVKAVVAIAGIMAGGRLVRLVTTSSRCCLKHHPYYLDLTLGFSIIACVPINSIVL